MYARLYISIKCKSEKETRVLDLKQKKKKHAPARSRPHTHIQHRHGNMFEEYEPPLKKVRESRCYVTRIGDRKSVSQQLPVVTTTGLSVTSYKLQKGHVLFSPANRNHRVTTMGNTVTWNPGAPRT